MKPRAGPYIKKQEVSMLTFKVRIFLPFGGKIEVTFFYFRR